MDLTGLIPAEDIYYLMGLCGLVCGALVAWCIADI